ncbi:acyl-CoA synthetase (AMP-forming)/AMP-acid ligase II [Litorivivens lipolytica]|uniref:Acyl-CoA synthetase (AMP-forming)/AMP-acid ligase II n=1 Tax=Litorivivens lipolytica TaxID=1524264 RepID=A0A7W4W2I8_9GAMM|nr:class I adenylate-forming enzyme family protein [Litorivivens lipolytica]MBB3046270.1 acyl-CoA synthetase (AMP-forming)/AMP-acid ligase II [Litorivivens lipolytica]
MTDIVARLNECASQLMQPGSPFEIGQQTINGTEFTVYKNAPTTVKDMLDAGRAHGDAVFIVYEGEQLSFNEFFRQADALAHQLVDRHGIEKGDRVAIAMRNYPEWMIAFTAVVSLGAIVVPLNSWGQRAELEYGLSDSGARVVVCDEQRYRFIDDLLPTMNVQAVVARATGDLGSNAVHYADFIAGGLGKPCPVFSCEAEDPVMIMYTSGTTGKPKGVLSNHRNIVQALTNFEFHAACSAMANPKAIEHMMTCGHAPKSLLAVPLFHVSGCHAQFLLTLRGGRCIVMMYKWDPGEALRLIEKEKITIFSGAPSMVMDLLEHPDFDKTDTSSLYTLSGGGAASPPKLNRLLEEKVTNFYAGAGYGMTESNATCSNCTGEAFLYKPRSSGTISPIVELKTVDENGKDLPRGEKGEIWLKSPTNVSEYWEKPEATAETFHQGWIATGDIGYIDDENFVFIVDRAKDMIIRGGENIAAGEIEACLLEMAEVHEVAAFGVPHEKLGEELAVAITPQPGATVSEQAVQAYVKSKLAGFKVPTYVWVREEELPRNATGKILKKQLQADYLKQHG